VQLTAAEKITLETIGSGDVRGRSALHDDFSFRRLAPQTRHRLCKMQAAEDQMRVSQRSARRHEPPVEDLIVTPALSKKRRAVPVAVAVPNACT
jgi:hypothetical protein